MKNKTFNVSFEIEVIAETPLEAAKTVQNMLQEKGDNWQFIIQEDNKEDVFSVDLAENDEDAVLPATYSPIIKI